jgi:hypothetical protein
LGNLAIAFNTQADNAYKHEAMPINYPFMVYEIDDSRSSEFVAMGYTVTTLEGFNAYRDAIDISAYHAAIATPVLEVIDSLVAEAAAKGGELAKQFKRENVLMGINSQQTVDVTKKCHWMAHFLADGSLKAAIIEMDLLLGQDLSAYSPFLTVERLTTYKHYVQEYLGVALT